MVEQSSQSLCETQFGVQEVPLVLSDFFTVGQVVPVVCPGIPWPPVHACDFSGRAMREFSAWHYINESWFLYEILTLHIDFFFVAFVDVLRVLVRQFWKTTCTRRGCFQHPIVRCIVHDSQSGIR